MENMLTDGYICPVCGQHSFEKKGDYEICPVCGWENDRIQVDNPDFSGGANTLSLNEAIEEYEEGMLGEDE